MSRAKNPPGGATFGTNVIDFHENLPMPHGLPPGITALAPYANAGVRDTARSFYLRFLNDTNRRVFVLGINPGRLGSGLTGVSFTDAVALRENCGVESNFSLQREISAKFVYMCIEEWGGAEKFYKDFYLTAVCPVGFTRNGINYNYYDEPALLSCVTPYIVQSLKKQIRFGAKRTAIILGKGKNQKAFAKLNDEFHFFDTILPLEHPRFVMQYRSAHLKEYVKKFNDTFAQALS